MDDTSPHCDRFIAKMKCWSQNSNTHFNMAQAKKRGERPKCILGNEKRNSTKPQKFFRHVETTQRFLNIGVKGEILVFLFSGFMRNESDFLKFMFLFFLQNSQNGKTVSQTSSYETKFRFLGKKDLQKVKNPLQNLRNPKVKISTNIGIPNFSRRIPEEQKWKAKLQL